MSMKKRADYQGRAIANFMATHRGLKPPGYKTTPDKSGSTPRATKFAIALFY